MHLIYANTEQNELNIANYFNNLNSVSKNGQEYLNNLKVFTCKFYKFGGKVMGGFLFVSLVLGLSGFCSWRDKPFFPSYHFLIPGFQ